MIKAQHTKNKRKNHRDALRKKTVLRTSRRGKFFTQESFTPKRMVIYFYIEDMKIIFIRNEDDSIIDMFSACNSYLKYHFHPHNPYRNVRHNHRSNLLFFLSYPTNIQVIDIIFQ